MTLEEALEAYSDDGGAYALEAYMAHADHERTARELIDDLYAEYVILCAEEHARALRTHNTETSH